MIQMTKLTLNVALLGALLASVSATPTPPMTKRWEQDVDCTWSEVDAKPGLMFAVGSDGINLNCDELEGASSKGGVKCYITNDNPDSLGDYTKCPSDPAPKKNPDGSEASSVSDGLIKTWCQSASGGPLALDFANIIGCMVYGYYEAEGDPIKEAETGAMGICDVVFAGACTWFFNIAPLLAEGMDRPCVDDPGSNACAFAGPG